MVLRAMPECRGVQAKMKFVKRWEPPFVKNVGLLLSGSVMAQILGLVGLPLLTRLYSPESMGALAIFSSLLGITAISGSGRFDQAIIQADEDEGRGLFWLAVLSMTFLLLPILLLLPVLSRWLPSWLNAPSLSWSVYWLPAAILFQVLSLLWIARLNQLGRFRRIAANRVIQSVATLSVSIFLGWLSGAASGLIIGSLSGMAFSFLFLLRGSPLPVWPGWGAVQVVFKKYVDFPTIVLLSAMLDALAVLATPLWIGVRFGEEAAGYFSLTWRVLSIPMILVGMAVSQVFYREVSILFRSDKAQALQLLIKTWWWLLLIGMIPFIVIYAYADSVFPFVFGSEWRLTGHMAQLLLPLAFIMFLNSPTSNIFLLENGRGVLIAFCTAELLARLLAIFVLGDNLQTALEYMVVLEVIVIVLFNVLAIKRVFL